jgi:GntR family transcriptional repressor for pyruvate dehydrogenase complex
MSRLHRQLLRVIITEIVAGTYPPGEMLPRETALVEQFSVSRGVVRECIRSLEERGMVSVKHGRGATVNPEDRWNVFDPDVLGSLLESDRSAEVLGEYLECRRILEIEAAGLAAVRATSPQLSALSEALAQMMAAAERARGNRAAEDLYHEADIGFHRAVIAATGNRALGRMTEPIHRALAEARRPLARPKLRLERSIPEHQRILSAIVEREPDEARAAMRDHLLTVEGYLKEYAEALAQAEPAGASDEVERP